MTRQPDRTPDADRDRAWQAMQTREQAEGIVRHVERSGAPPHGSETRDLFLVLAALWRRLDAIERAPEDR